MSIISNCTESVIKNAAASLIEGNLVAFPTETVYGLGVDATNENAVSRVYEVKARPAGHPLIVHISSIEYLDKWARDIPEYAVKLARVFWPGPLTLILSRTNLAKNFITGCQDNVGIRVPSHAIALHLLKEFESLGGFGIAAPSANRFGAVSPTTAGAVNSELGSYLKNSDYILDGGNCQVGVESTIVDCSQQIPVILRPGMISREQIESTLDMQIRFVNSNHDIKAPGLFKSHYSPNAKVFLKNSPKPGDGLIALISFPTPTGVIRLAEPRNNVEYAQILYEALRLADKKGIKNVFAIPPTGEGAAVAINDRLIKASFH